MRQAPVRLHIFALVIALLWAVPSALADGTGPGPAHQHHNGPSDGRTKLNVPPMMQEHQKRNMREHLRAVQEIVALLAAGDYEKGSQTAREKLGLSEEMMKMCSMFGDEGFTRMGISFHESGDALGEALKAKDMKKSLAALNSTLTKCVACHDAYKQ